MAFAEVSPIASVVLRRRLVGPRSLCVDCRLYLVGVLCVLIWLVVLETRLCMPTHPVLSPAIDNIPEDLRDPFYIDQYEQEHIKPPVIKLLLSSELYCRVCSLILKGDQAATLQGHQSVIQALSRKGIYVMESDDTPVTDADLSQAPIKMVSV